MEINRVESNLESYNIISILKMANIDSEKVHLTEEQFINIYKLYRGSLKDEENSINYNLKGMQYIIQRYKTIESWNKADSSEKVFIERNEFSSLLYYQVMVLLGRVKLDIEVLKRYNLPDLLMREEKKLILETAEKIGYVKSNKADKQIIQAFNKLKFYTLKDVRDVDEQDYLKFKMDINNISPDKMFNILKKWGNISKDSMYMDICKKDREYSVDKIETRHESIEDLYFQFKNYSDNLEDKNTAFKKVTICKRFIEWIDDNYRDIDDLRKINYDHIEFFINYIKNAKLNGKKDYSQATINSEISRFKNGILKYLVINNILSDEVGIKVFADDADYNELYYPKTKGLPKPISIKDRRKIEKALFKEYNDIDEAMLDIIRLCYFLGARPSEVLSLRVSCIKGIVEEAGSIHIHRTKGFKERYVPLIDESYEIVSKWVNINKKSIPIYLEYDKQTSKRLFHVRGKVYALATIDAAFNNLMIRNGIVNSDNKSKYTLYVLRRIRITTWLESDLSEEEVAYLVGHDDIDSHNSYIVSKELRRKNAKKVYNKFYRDTLENRIDETQKNINLEEEKNNELEDFINTIHEIENKNLNTVMKENIIKEFNEYTIPLPCGSCFAKVYDENFECAMMDLPCLECDKLQKENMDLEILNDYIKNLFISRNNKKKKGLDGLVMRTENQIEKVKDFYVNRLDKDLDEVSKLFIDIENSIKVKRGRPKKVGR
ncbi:MAG: tyrosine-type recombinase/integrase [Sarcina sp.]